MGFINKECPTDKTVTGFRILSQLIYSNLTNSFTVLTGIDVHIIHVSDSFGLHANKSAVKQTPKRETVFHIYLVYRVPITARRVGSLVDKVAVVATPATHEARLLGYQVCV